MHPKHNLKKHYLKELGKSNFKEKLSLLISLVWSYFYNVINITIIIIVVIIVNTTTVCFLFYFTTIIIIINIIYLTTYLFFNVNFFFILI